MNGEETVGQILREARIARGLSRERLALELKLTLRHLEAIESDDWETLPPGRPRPLARQLAERLGVDLDAHGEAFHSLPGAHEAEPPDPRQERLERMVMGLLTLASILLVLWLVVPGPSLGRKRPSGNLAAFLGPALPPPPPPSHSPYPVLGEMLPEAPINEQGILVSLRALDTCEARLEPAPEAGMPPQSHTMRISEPWRLRVKGPFTLTLDNAGVVNVEVAGVRIIHGQSVGEAWTGQFDAQGHWMKPPSPAPEPVPAAPEPPDDPDETQP